MADSEKEDVPIASQDCFSVRLNTEDENEGKP
jgi:hypothetical protein